MLARVSRGRDGQVIRYGELAVNTLSREVTVGHVVTVAVAAGVHATTDSTFYTHYSLLRATEEALGITTYLGNAATANDMRPGMGF